MRMQQISPAQAYELISDSELFNRIGDGSISYENFSMPENHIYVGAFDDEDLIGFYWMHHENSVTVQIHANILLKHRDKSSQATRGIIDFIYEMMPNIHKVNAKIPTCYPDVYKHAIKHGFKDEGLDRLSSVRDGVLYDQHILGLTREEMRNGSC